MATSSNQSGFVDSWQRGKSVIECNLHMLETEDFTDVTFLVGSEEQVVRAHRYVLASRSCVFHAMFCGRMAEQGEITIPDIEVNVFKDFLRFLYTDSCTINSENVAGLLYSSRKYDVETLFKQSTCFLKESLSEENLCEILEESHGYGETDLEQEALKMLSQAGPKVIASAGFLVLCFRCFGIFLNSNDLNLREEQVFEAALSWTKAECEREGLSPSHENIRKVLGEMVYEIRFASLSLDFIADVVGPSGILTGDERVKIMDRILKSCLDISPFKSDTRKIMNPAEEETSSGIFIVNRFNAILEPLPQSSCKVISFSTNKDIYLIGCQMFGSDKEIRLLLNIRIFDDQNNLISHPVMMNLWTLSNTVNDIMFLDQVSIKGRHIYRFMVEFSSNLKLYGGAKGVSKVDVDGVEFIFLDDTFYRSNTWYRSVITDGLIPGLIWRKRVKEN